MKKILILSFYYYPDLCAGSFRASALIDALEKIDSNLKIHVVTTMPNRYKTFKAEAKQHERIRNIKIDRIELPTHKSGLLDQSKAFSKYFLEALKKTSKEDYDLVFATSSRLFTAFLGSMVSRRKKLPLYLDIRDIFTDTMNEVLTNKIAKYSIMPFLGFIERITFSKAKHINLVSEGFKEYFTKRYKTNYSFYTNGIDEEFFNYDFNKSTKSALPIISYAGNIGKGQGLHSIIPNMAIALKGKYIIQIVGDGGAKNLLVEQLNQKNIDNVRLVDPVNRNELKAIYKESDFLFLHLNNYKAFEKVLPSKIFEYAITNKPIIAGVAGYAKTFLETELPETLVFEPGNNDELIAKLINFNFSKNTSSKFIEKYKRANVMLKMSSELKNDFLS